MIKGVSLTFVRLWIFDYLFFISGRSKSAGFFVVNLMLRLILSKTIKGKECGGEGNV